jgi:glycine/D-amino acid oxidase-like deaminating enzyme
MSLDPHSGRSYWLTPPRRGIGSTVLRRDLEADAVVVGAGITGALVADALVRSGLSVVIADAHEPALGSTAASTALLQYDLDVPLARLEIGLGVDRAQQAYHAGIEALALLNQRTTELGIPFDRLPSLYVATSASRTQALREEFDARSRAGIAVDWVDQDELVDTYGLHGQAAISSLSAATTDPYALTIGLLRRAEAGGARIFSPSRVTAISRHGDRRLAHTAGGPTISARWVVWATGYESAALLPAGMVDLDSTYAIAAAATGGAEALRHCLWWEFADPYLYSRWDGANLLVGGEDEPFADPARRDRLIPEKARVLAAKYRKLVPEIRLTTTHAWAGAFGTTPDGLGYIGPLPADPRVLFALGFGGNGMTMSALAARIIADLVTDRANTEQSLYRLERPLVRVVRRRGVRAGAAPAAAQAVVPLKPDPL